MFPYHGENSTPSTLAAICFGGPVCHTSPCGCSSSAAGRIRWQLSLAVQQHPIASAHCLNAVGGVERARAQVHGHGAGRSHWCTADSADADASAATEIPCQ
ncbi:hypothetical protein BV25DRAFT_948740 [Artomyces pyxidatus]|uniref:Uncharacterized protein n=1 Tax=Artomyces pyxidatus TaxID=48021 RepID=A0ACB8SW47_9AGAM|nr:hypothetical protein BV25DRAFT_948740 [Artomyces pyxidatus]